MVPVILRFDAVRNTQGDSVAHFPKLCQGAPFAFGLKIRRADLSYRVWDADEIVWRIKLRPSDKHELMTLSKTNGNFVVDGDVLNFIILAEDWEGVTLPNSSNHREQDVPFSFVVDFLDTEGRVIERFCQGSGFILVDLAL